MCPNQDLENGLLEILAPVAAGHPAKGLLLFVRQLDSRSEIVVDKVKRHRRRLPVPGPSSGAIRIHAGSTAAAARSLLNRGRQFPLGTAYDAAILGQGGHGRHPFLRGCAIHEDMTNRRHVPPVRPEHCDVWCSSAMRSGSVSP